jgi:biopolymer transport protein ExbB/TolQ
VGMVGTVIGFMLMLGSSFAEIDPSNVDSMKRVITDMASGMSTALLTTLCGLVASLFVKVQVIIQEQEYV